MVPALTTFGGRALDGRPALAYDVERRGVTPTSVVGETEMNDELFSDLLESVRQGGATLRGEMSPSRTFEIKPLVVRKIRSTSRAHHTRPQSVPHMDTEKALEFLRAHQPMPPDDIISDADGRTFAQILRHFEAMPDERCIPLLIHSVSLDTGLGMYEHIGFVLMAHPRERVVPICSAA